MTAIGEFDEVYSFKGQLYAQAYKMTQRAEDAQDLVQETLTRAWINWHLFTPGTNLGGWLHTILKNLHYSEWRLKRSARRNEILHGELYSNKQYYEPTVVLNSFWEYKSPSAPSAEEEAMDKLTDPALRAAMMKLPEEFRIALYLADVEGYSYQEISEIMDCPLGTVMSRVFRAKERLYKLLTDTKL